MKLPWQKDKGSGKLAEPLTQEEREAASRRYRRKRRIDRANPIGLSSLSAKKMAPAAVFTRHGLTDGEGHVLGYVDAPPRAPKVTPAQWLAGKAKAAKMLEDAK